MSLTVCRSTVLQELGRPTASVLRYTVPHPPSPLNRPVASSTAPMLTKSTDDILALSRELHVRYALTMFEVRCCRCPFSLVLLYTTFDLLLQMIVLSASLPLLLLALRYSAGFCCLCFLILCVVTAISPGFLISTRHPCRSLWPCAC